MLVRQRSPAKRTSSKVHVLAVLSRNGFIEIFAPLGVQIYVAQRLDVPAALEAQAEEYLDGTLPKVFRRLFIPGCLRATGLVERVTPERALATLHELEELRELRRLKHDMEVKHGN